MAYSVNWTTKLITIPLADLVNVSVGIYNLDMSAFHKEIRRLEWGVNDGLPYPEILSYVSQNEFGGTILAPVVKVINGYSVEFESGLYAVNLTGANNNVADVTVVNGVSVRPQNSVGLQIVQSDNAATEPDNATIAAIAVAVAALNDLSSTEVQTLLDGVPADVLAAAQVTPIHADTKKMNGASVLGVGSEADKWRGA